MILYRKFKDSGKFDEEVTPAQADSARNARLNDIYDKVYRVDSLVSTMDSPPWWYDPSPVVGEKARNYTLEYLQSPKYKERLRNEVKQSDIGSKLPWISDWITDKLISRNINTVKDLDYRGRSPYEGYSFYDPNKNIVRLASETIAMEDASNADDAIKEKLAYELGLHETAHATNSFGGSFIQNEDLRSPLYNSMTDRIKDPYADDHDKLNSETHSDIMALRGLLKDIGLYDAGTQDFTKEVLDKAKILLKGKSFLLNRLRRLYNDDDLILFMNKIADSDVRNKNTYRKPNIT